jgi:fused signal recognition particle receptor
VIDLLRRGLITRFGDETPELVTSSDRPTVVLVAGVNGVGKTTSIAKIASAYAQQGKSVLLAAADTYRAGAVEQLATWAQRIGVDIVRGDGGADPASVAFDGAQAALARNVDVLIVDTAGRLHTDEGLMRELTKIHAVIQKKIPGAPHEVLLVLDATQGQNALVQARRFSESIPVTGIFLAKLDGTARGGIAVAIHDELGVPIKLVGTGERVEDVEGFDSRIFVEGLVGE